MVGVGGGGFWKKELGNLIWWREDVGSKLGGRDGGKRSLYGSLIF